MIATGPYHHDFPINFGKSIVGRISGDFIVT
jgi:hypothetical protein